LPSFFKHKIWRKPESSIFHDFWTPAFAGVTLQETFLKSSRLLIDLLIAHCALIIDH